MHPPHIAMARVIRHVRSNYNIFVGVLVVVDKSILWRLGVAGSFFLSSLAVQADSLLEQVVAGAKADKQLLWSVERVNSDFDTSGKLTETSVARFNGAAAKGTRWSLVSIDGKMPKPSADKEFTKNFNAGDFAPTYAQVADLLAGPATKISPNCYRLMGLPAKTVMAAGYDLSAYLQADVIVDVSGSQPFVSQVKITAPKAFKPMSLSKVQRLDRTLTFTRGPNGLPILATSVVSADFKVMLKTISLRTKTEFLGQKALTQTARISNGYAR